MDGRFMAGAATIAAEGVSKRFGTNQVLTRVTLEVAERDVVCVIGPSGSGKTTLLRCLALLEEPSDGRVTMNGMVIAKPDAEAAVKRAARSVRPDIGMVFQHFNLWPHMSVIENVIEAPIRVKAMPTRSNSSCACSRACAFGTLRALIGPSVMLSSTDLWANRLND